MANSKTSWVVLVALAAIVAAIFALVANHALGEGLDRAMILLAGMLSAAVLSGVSQMLFFHRELEASPVAFDAGYNRRMMDDVIDVEFQGLDVPARRGAIDDRGREWEPAAGDLLARDTTLALAKLRIDIERELRRVAAATDATIDPRRSSISRLMTSLARSEVLAQGLVSTLENILTVCDGAVHGGNVDAELASTILDIGEDAICVLSTYPKTSAAFPERVTS